MTTTTTNLNLRTGAGTENSIITTIPADSEVAVGPVKVGEDLWYPVTYNNQQGWVHGGYLHFDEPTPNSDYIDDAMALCVRMLGLWYRWGGNFTQEPFDAKRGDCSGFVGFVASVMGYQPGSNALYNYSANQMYQAFNSGTWAAKRIKPGDEQAMDIVFYGTTSKVGHVVYAVGDGRVIGSSGGFEATTSDAAAMRVGAKVRYDTLNFHKNPIQGIFRPEYR